MKRDYETLPENLKACVDEAFDNFTILLRNEGITPPMDDRAEVLIDAMTTYLQVTVSLRHENFRIQDKENVHMDGRRTAFKVFKRQGSSFVYDGVYFALGWDRTDEQCVEHYLSEMDDEQ